MPICALCRQVIEVDRYFSRKSACPRCSGDLHICLNCRFYSETSHNKCREAKAEHQRSRDRANFCDFFAFRAGGAAAPDDKDEALRRLNDLFRK